MGRNDKGGKRLGGETTRGGECFGGKTSLIRDNYPIWVTFQNTWLFSFQRKRAQFVLRSCSLERLHYSEPEVSF